MTVTRRGILAAGALSLAAPAVVAAEKTRVLRFMPAVDLTFLDPHINTSNVTRNHGGLVFDQLYGTNAAFEAKPQMVAGHVVEDDGLTWRLTLRDGLLWHDGERVLARDCVASIRRWAVRDVLGTEIVDLSNEILAADDKTIVFRLKRPFPMLPNALGKPNANMPAMMPERLAKTDAYKPIPELIGSGPFRYLAAERMQGARNVYAKFEQYVPVPTGSPDRGTGPKIVHFDRVEWTTMPDQGTAFAALQKGEHDWWEYAAHDLMPILRKASDIRSAVLETEGEMSLVRFNQLHPPFNNPAIRRVILRCIDQADFVNAIAGGDPELQRTGIGVFAPGLPSSSTAGLDELKKPLTDAQARVELEKAGYRGERVLQIAPADYPNVRASSEVLADLLKRIGINLDYVQTDWGTMSGRNTKRDPIDAGGTNIHTLNVPGLAVASPLLNGRLRGVGAVESGWYRHDRYEALRTAWLGETDASKRKALVDDMQREVLTNVAYAPCGTTFQPSARRSDLTGILSGVAKFWNVRRA